MNKQKIVLYNPKAVFFDMPLALMAIGSQLDASIYEVVIIDGRLQKDSKPLLKEHLKDALCFGTTVLTGSPLNDAMEISEYVRTINNDIPIIWGGWHPSLFPLEILKDLSYVDVTVQGQGEKTFEELVHAYHKQESLDGIKGICIRDEEGKPKKNSPRVLVPMDDLPAINYDFIEVEKYFELKGKRQLDYISSTGCFFRCTFCADPFVFNRSFTAISADKMVSEIEKLYHKYKFDDLNFQDETFFTYPKRIAKIAQLFIKKGIKTSWAGTMRADQGYRMTDEQFELCVKSGLRRVLIGVESGSQEMMDWLAKDIKLEHVYFCAKRCKKYGVNVIFPFIVGFPEESDESIIATTNMIKELRQMSNGFDTPVFYFKPYPGSKITDDVVKKGYKLPANTKSWGEFDYIGSKGPWVSKQKYRFFERFKFYTKAAYSKQSGSFKVVQLIAKLRCKTNFYALPFEKSIYETFTNKQKLS